MTMVSGRPMAKLALIAGSALALTWWHQRGRIAALRKRLSARAPPVLQGQPSTGYPCPPIVARYLELALAGSPGIPTGVEIDQAGVLRGDTSSAKWLPFQAVHRVAVSRLGFLWDAKVTVLPGIHVRVLDSLIDGAGAGRILLQSIIPLGAKADSEPMNSGSLHRLLAESVWYPWVLVPGEHLSWKAVSDDRAEATLTLGSTSVSLMFRFAPNGEVAGIYTPARWGNFAGRYRQLPWEGHFGDYVERGGIRIPSWGEVGWYLHEELKLVWRGRIRGYRMISDLNAAPGYQLAKADMSSHHPPRVVR
jgi:hypothetical protein